MNLPPFLAARVRGPFISVALVCMLGVFLDRGSNLVLNSRNADRLEAAYEALGRPDNSSSKIFCNLASFLGYLAARLVDSEKSSAT